ncbi:MAG: DUF5711 family protein [Candidatus Onthomonas sp.]
MDDKKNETAGAAGQEKKTPEILRILLRVLTLILTILLVLGGVLLVLNRDRINLDSVKRYLTYRALERSDEGQGVEFPIANEDGTIFAALGDSILACSGNRILLYSDSGTAYVDMETALSQPVITTAGNYALVYDAGGSQLYLFSGRQLVFQYATEGDYALISAQVNENGWLAVVEQASGYKGAVTVYNASHKEMITENISSSFVMDAAVSPDNRQLAVLTIEQQDLSFASTLTMYNVSDGESTVSAVVSDTPALELRWDDSGLWFQEQSGLRLVGTDCQVLGQWEDESLYLRGYSLHGDGFAVEYFSRSRAGSVGQVVVVDSQGNAVASLDVGEEVLSITAAGRYIALLTNSRLTIYTSDLTEYAVLDNTNGILQALVRTDGTAVLVMGETANVFLP